MKAEGNKKANWFSVTALGARVVRLARQAENERGWGHGGELPLSLGKDRRD